MTTKIWITRTAPAASRSVQAWADVGFDPVAAPLLTAEPVAANIATPDDAILIFTSAHGVRHCSIRGRDQRVYCVGDATARVARDHGFSNVVSADGDWKKLVGIIEATTKPIVHISGDVVRGNLVGTLCRRGFNAQRQVVYRIETEKKWPLDVNQIGAVAIYSPMASETLMALPERDLSHLTAYCLSANVAAPLHGMDVRIADAPNERALIACSRAAEA